MEKMCGITDIGIMFPQLVKIIFLIVLSMELLFSQATTNEVCDNIGNLTDIVKSHTDILNDFPNYQGRTKGLESEVRRLRFSLENIKQNLSSLAEYQNQTVTVLNDVTELKTVSNSFIKKLGSLDTYQGTTDYLVDDVAQLKASLESHTESLGNLEPYKEKTIVIQNDIINIKESVRKYSLKRDDAAHQKIDTLYQNYTMRQSEIENKFQEVHNLAGAQNKTIEKLTKLAISLDQVTKEQQIIQKKLDTQQKTIEKLDTRASALEQVTKEQQIMKQKLEQLSGQLQQLKSQTAHPVIQPTTTITPTTPASTTQQPNSGVHVIRKHAHARGTNIVITV